MEVTGYNIFFRAKGKPEIDLRLIVNQQNCFIVIASVVAEEIAALVKRGHHRECVLGFMEKIVILLPGDDEGAIKQAIDMLVQIGKYYEGS